MSAKDVDVALLKIFEAFFDAGASPRPTKLLFDLVKKWKPIRVGYEKYGLMGDTEHIKREQYLTNTDFRLVELGGSTPKVDRIRKLVPLFENGKILIPRSLHRTIYDGTTVELIRAFVEEEYCAFPVARHDDMLDCFARILDPDLRTRTPHLGAGGRRHEDRPTSYLPATRADRMRQRLANPLQLVHERPERWR